METDYTRMYYLMLVQSALSDLLHKGCGQVAWFNTRRSQVLHHGNMTTSQVQ